MHFLQDVLRCSTRFIMDLVAEEMAMFRDVLELPQHVGMANGTNEDRLSPQHKDTITKVVRLLRDEGVGVEEIATFSQALSVKDAISSACLRSQDSLNIPAYNAYIQAGELEFILPATPKNATQLKQSNIGMVATHVKSKELMLVVLRPLMRELREVGGGSLCASIGPFDNKRKAFSAGRQPALLGSPCASIGPFDNKGKAFSTGRQPALFKFLGARFLWIPRFSTYILRTTHVTMVCMQSVDQNVSVKSPEVQMVFI